jgi:hypothetical protein
MISASRTPEGKQMPENQQTVQGSDLTENQQIVQNLRDAFNDTIDIAEELNINAEELERAKQEIIGQIIDACPEADPGTFIQLTNGKWTMLEIIRKYPGKFVHLPDGRWAGREGDGVVTLYSD